MISDDPLSLWSASLLSGSVAETWSEAVAASLGGFVMVHVGGLVTVEEEFGLFFVAVCLTVDAPADDDDLCLCFEFE